MSKYKAIPEGFMTAGEAAKRAGVTVRTLQYYDKEGLLLPSAESEGGRRLYTDKDLVTLHQIISLKSLGFSLKDIKKRLFPMETPGEVAKILEEQAEGIRREIEHLKVSLSEIEQLKKEVLQMQTVNFKKYADIIVNLRMNNEYYFLIKKFDDKTLDHIRNRFDKESGLKFISNFTALCDKITELKKEKLPPEDEKCQQAAGEFWNMVIEFTDGDMSMLTELIKFGSYSAAQDSWEEKQKAVNEFIGPALQIYLSRRGISPFEEAEK